MTKAEMYVAIFNKCMDTGLALRQLNKRHLFVDSNGNSQSMTEWAATNAQAVIKYGEKEGWFV